MDGLVEVLLDATRKHAEPLGFGRLWRLDPGDTVEVDTPNAAVTLLDCNDGDPCTAADTCQAGTCTGARAREFKGCAGRRSAA